MQLQPDPQAEFKRDLREVLDDLYQFLVEKNRKYGDSALSPTRCFSKLSASEGIRVRIDDKISRLMSDQLDDDEDVVRDLFGYLAIFYIAKKRESRPSDLVDIVDRSVDNIQRELRQGIPFK